MLKIHVSSPSPDTNPQYTPSLADLSRNASVISSSSSSSSTSDLTIQTPSRPRPIRTFSSPRQPLRSRSPQSPSTPRGSRHPPYLARELGISEDPEDRHTDLKPPPSRAQSRSRNSSVNGRISVSDFEFGRVLGEGSYSTVSLAKHISTGKEYAIKVIDKGHLKRKDKVPTALAEKNTLVKLGSGHPGIVRLHWTFQDEWSLYFVLDLARNGELQTRLSRLGSLSTTCARYYAAQLVDALHYMHSKGVIHRDLKPENLLLDDNFRIKITDFGTGKILESGAGRAKTFVGTAQYVSPELLEDGETSMSSDFWALGCIIYQMIAGRFAFQGLSEFLTLQKVKQLDFTFPDGFDEQAKDLVQKLLVRDPEARLGVGPPGSANDIQALRSHPFFAPINWSTLWTSPAPPLEAGLVKKEQPTGNSQSSMSNWEDVGAAWDEVIDGDGSHDVDGIGWASDGEIGEYQLAKSPYQTNGHTPHPEEVGPTGETRPDAYASTTSIPQVGDHVQASSSSSQHNGHSHCSSVRFVEGETAQTESDAEEDKDIVPPMLDDIPTAVRTPAIEVPARSARNSYSTGSTTSSSDGSPPVDKLDAALEAARGRNRAQTPIQGNGSSEEWSTMLMPGETVLFNAHVETSPLRRRASRLLAIAGAQRRKSRELVLTDRRLVCLKHKPGHAFTISTELILQPSEKEKDCRRVIISVEPKGEREFVVVTSSKSYSFIASSPSLASTWTRKIREALKSQEQQGSASQHQRQVTNSSDERT